MGATTSVFVSDTFSVTNVVLNLLSIVFLLEIDSIFLAFVLPENHIEEMRVFIENTLSQSGNDKTTILPWLWSRIISIFSTILMIVSVTSLDEVISVIAYFVPSLSANCTDAFYAMTFFYLNVGVLPFMIIHSMGKGILNFTRFEHVWKACIHFVLNLFRNTGAMF